MKDRKAAPGTRRRGGVRRLDQLQVAADKHGQLLRLGGQRLVDSALVGEAAAKKGVQAESDASEPERVDVKRVGVARSLDRSLSSGSSLSWLDLAKGGCCVFVHFCQL